MSTLATITNNYLRDIDKHSIDEISKRYEAAILDGKLDPVEALIISKKGQEIYKAIENRVRPVAESDSHVSKGEGLVKFSATVEQAETGVKYEYSNCGDKIWEELKSKTDALSSELKDREKFLRGVKNEQGCFDAETGESWTVTPPIRTGKLGLKVTLK